MKTIFYISFLSLVCFISCNNQSETKNIQINNHQNKVRKNSDLTPIWGHRFTITGDFNGDDLTETLTEHYFDGKKNTETNKFYEDIEFDSLVSLTIKKNPISFVASTNKHIDTLHISSGGQLLGLSYLKNEGDLNDDGTDEISYVIDWADWSNLNTCHLMTLRNNKWSELYSFSIWNWQIPDNLEGFKGLIKPMNKNKIQVIYMNNEAIEDTAIINLKH